MLHDDEHRAGVVADVMQRADVGMRQARNRLRLAFEAFAQLGGCCHIQREDLDGNCSIESRVAGFVHLAHAPGANEAKGYPYGPSRVPVMRLKEGAAPAREYTPRGKTRGPGGPD